MRECPTFRARTSPPEDVPTRPIDEEITDALLVPREVVGHHLAEPARVPKLLGLDAGDDLPGLFDKGVQLGVAAGVRSPESVETLRQAVVATPRKTFG